METGELPSYRPGVSPLPAARRASRQRRLFLSTAWLGGSLVALLVAVPMCAGARTGRSVAINLAHLDALRVPIAGGKTIWAAAWRPAAKGRAIPQADPETGVLARTEDLARIAACYLEAPADRGKPALQALEWLLLAQAPDGRFAYGIAEDGRPAGPVRLDWPAARALWALGQAARLLPAADPLRPKVLAAAELTAKAFAHARTGRLIEGSAAQSAAVVLGLVELHKAGRADPLLGDLAGAIAEQQAGEPGLFPYQAHLPTRNPALWHAYGAYQLAALAEAGFALGNRKLLAAAEREAASWTVHVLVSGGPIWGFAPAPRTYPQIAYNLEPTVRGLLALSRATGKDAYARLAGLFGAWLLGDNPAGKAMYDEATGRVRDGLDPGGMADGAGAEATALGLATLQLLAADATAARYLHSRESGARRAFAARTTKTPRTVPGSGPYAGSAFVLMAPGKRVSFDLGADGPMLLSPIYLRGLADPAAAGALELRAGSWSERYPMPEPADPALGPVLELGRMTQVAELRRGDRASVGLGRGSTLPVAVDGVLCQPVVEYRAWTLGKGKIAVVKSLSGQLLPLQYAWPGAAVAAYSPAGKQVRAGEDLEPYGYALIESGM